MIPIFPIHGNSKSQAYKAGLSPPSPSPDSATGAMAFTMSFGYSELSASLSSTTTTSSSTSSIPPPPPPPPTPNDMLDISPRKCSFSSSTPRTNTCAFPSWPNRPSLLNCRGSEAESTANSYLSDEDLLVPDSPDEESAAHSPPAGTALTTEQQIQAIKAAADEEDRCRALFMAQVQAHARAHVHQGRRLTTTTTAQMEREILPKRSKRRSRSDKKRPRLGSNRG